MQRRTALSAMAAGLAATAGCSLLERRSTVGGEDVPPPPAEDPDRDVAGSVPESRRFRPAATAASGLTLEALAWHGHDRIRYVPEDEEGFAVYEPDGWVVAYDFALENRGEERVSVDSDYAFVLRADGTEYDHRHRLGDDVSLSQINQPDDRPEVRRPVWYEMFDPGQREELQLLFELPKTPSVPHYLVWYDDGPVEGAGSPVYVLPAE